MPKPKKVVYHPCSVRQLPDSDQIAAAQFACSINPANAPNFAAGENLTPAKIAIVTSKYFGPAGVHLTVGFMEQTSASLADKIISHMNAWGQYANVQFVMGTGAWTRAQVRISRGSGGYWSYLGTDVLRIPANQPTMNLQGFTINTVDSEYRRVVRHETGHTLGCPHEHMRRQIVARLDVPKTLAYFEQTQGWSEQDVYQQVLTAIEDRLLTGATPNAETDSVMCYGLPASITIDGQPIPGGIDITASDGMAIGKCYPLAVTPPPQPTDGGIEIVLPQGVKPGKWLFKPNQ